MQSIDFKPIKTVSGKSRRIKMPELCPTQSSDNNCIPWYASGWFMAILIVVFFIVFAILIWWFFQQMFSRVDKAVENRIDQIGQTVSTTITRLENDAEKIFQRAETAVIVLIDEILSKFGRDALDKDSLIAKIQNNKLFQSTTGKENDKSLTNTGNNPGNDGENIPTPSLVNCNYKYRNN